MSTSLAVLPISQLIWPRAIISVCSKHYAVQHKRSLTRTWLYSKKPRRVAGRTIVVIILVVIVVLLISVALLWIVNHYRRKRKHK
jgi:heme/copper-type cytochrome/quinol oxidase subunit 2